MNRTGGFELTLTALAIATALTIPIGGAFGAPTASAQRYLIQPKTSDGFDAMRSDVVSLGGQVVKEFPQVGLMVVTLPADVSRTQVLQDGKSHIGTMAKDQIVRLVNPAMQEELWGKAFSSTPSRTRIELDASRIIPPASENGSTAGDPAVVDYPELTWNLYRMNAPIAWDGLVPVSEPLAGATIRVAVADTGLDYTHAELQGQVEGVEDFTVLEEPYPICKTYYGTSDADLAANEDPAVNADLDFNGHGTWIGGNIAANLDGAGINGIAPDVTLWAFKISQWCGSAYDSEIIAAFLAAADHDPKIDILSISFGGYKDRKDPEQDAVYKQLSMAVAYAKSKGVTIVASAGNEHVRIGNGGKVLSRGSLTSPGATVEDLYGLYETPAGIPGVIMVSATANIVNATSASCDADNLDALGDPMCKPDSDRHQPFGVGRENQLAYYSNYGPRVDIAAPGGARKYNLPAADAGGTAGAPWSLLAPSNDDGWNAWQDFSITSNYTVQIPCVTFSGGDDFVEDQCYSTIQGTSMATPHVSAALALIAATRPDLRGSPDALLAHLKSDAMVLSANKTPPLSATDKSVGDLEGQGSPKCKKGYCHLGGQAIPAKEAFGAGLVYIRDN